MPFISQGFCNPHNPLSLPKVFFAKPIGVGKRIPLGSLSFRPIGPCPSPVRWAASIYPVLHCFTI
jgi:hypothetical protein